MSDRISGMKAPELSREESVPRKKRPCSFSPSREAGKLNRVPMDLTDLTDLTDHSDRHVFVPSFPEPGTVVAKAAVMAPRATTGISESVYGFTPERSP